MIFFFKEHIYIHKLNMAFSQEKLVHSSNIGYDIHQMFLLHLQLLHAAQIT